MMGGTKLGISWLQTMTLTAPSPLQTPTILQLEAVSRQFSTTALPAVAQVSLSLNSGEILGLLGPSGCGKTTLLRLIAGFERPQSGRVTVAGQTVADANHWIAPERRTVGMVFQDYALFPHLTVAENVGFGLRQRGRSRQPDQKPAEAAVAAALALVGLMGLERRYPHELSGGQQQRVALARALAPRPALLLLDEPLSNLDLQVRLHLRRELRDILKATQTTAVFVTHDQEEALALCDRVAVMRQGKIEQLDRPEQLYQQPQSRFVAEFVTQANFLAARWRDNRWQTEIGSFGAEAIYGKAEDGNQAGKPALGETADLMIRPEDLGLRPDPAGALVVCDRHFLGRDYAYWLQTASGQILQARLSSSSFSVGDRVSAMASQVRLFPASGS